MKSVVALIFILCAGTAHARCVAVGDCQTAIDAATARVQAMKPAQDQIQARYRGDIAQVQALRWGDPARHAAQADADQTMIQIKHMARERKKLDREAVSARRDMDGVLRALPKR
jgi:hypothetical protein